MYVLMYENISIFFQVLPELTPLKYSPPIYTRLDDAQIIMYMLNHVRLIRFESFYLMLTYSLPGFTTSELFDRATWLCSPGNEADMFEAFLQTKNIMDDDPFGIFDMNGMMPEEKIVTYMLVLKHFMLPLDCVDRPFLPISIDVWDDLYNQEADMLVYEYQEFCIEHNIDIV